MAQKGPTLNEIRITEATQLVENWNAIKQFMQYACSNAAIAPEYEQNFLRVRTEASRLSRAISQKLPEGIKLQSLELGDLLKRIYSLEDVRNQPDADRQILFEQWHKVRLSIMEILGALQYIGAGYVYDPVTRQDEGGTSIAKLKGGAAGGKKKTGGSKKVVVIIIIALLCAVGYWYVNK